MRGTSCTFAKCPEGFGVLAAVAGRPISLLWHRGARGFRAQRTPNWIGSRLSMFDLAAGPIALSFAI